MFRHTFVRLLIFLGLLVQAGGVSAANYTDRFGLRLSLGGKPYASFLLNSANDVAAALLGPLSSASAMFRQYASVGVGIPVHFDVTYAITNALEIFVGGTYTPSFLLLGRDKYFMPGEVVIGYRYYVNVDEPVKAFMGNQLGFGIIPFALSGEIHFGLQWDLNAHFSLLVQESAGLATVFVGSEAYGLGFQPSIALSFGAQCHF